MQATVKITVRLPSALHRKLKQRAQSTHSSLNKVLVETLSEGLSEGYHVAPNEERFWHSLRESGLWEPLGSEWEQDYSGVQAPSHEELQEALKGTPPLSDIIIEERRERR